MTDDTTRKLREAALTENQILEIAQTLPDSQFGGYRGWAMCGYQQDANGEYTVPRVPSALLQFSGVLCKAVEAAVLEEITRSGHKIVPVEPTGKMLDALCHKAARGYVKQRYADMLEAAPEYKP